MANFPEFTDGVTALSEQYLNGLVPASSYLVSGGIPTTATGLAVNQPATVAVINDGATDALEKRAASQVVNMGAGAVAQDNYVDLRNDGVYIVSTVAAGAAAPVPAANVLRLYKATTNAGNTAVVFPVTDLSVKAPVAQAIVAADLTEQATNDALTPSGTLLTSLNRIRYQMAQMVGGAWNAARAFVQLSPASQQAGAINISGAVSAAAFDIAGTGHAFDATHLTLTDGAGHTFEVTPAGLITTSAALPSNSTTKSSFGAKRWYLAQTAGDDVSSGQFDYRGDDPNAVSIVGAGTGNTNRKLTLWDIVSIIGTLTTGGALTVSAGGAAITGDTTISTKLTVAGRQIGAGRAAPTSTYLTGQALALPAVGLYTTVTGETYSFTTLQPGSRVQVNVSIPVNMNTLAGDLKFLLTVTAVPTGSALPLAGLAPQWGTVKQGVVHGMAEVTTVFDADKAGTYTLAIQYVTTAGASGSAIYNEVCNFGGVPTYQGTILFTELSG